MDNDNLYPSGGFQPFAEPEEQKQERKTEKSEAKAGHLVIEKIIKRFEERIAFYDTVSSIPDEVRKDPAKFMHTVEANDLAKLNLTDELEWLKGLTE